MKVNIIPISNLFISLIPAFIVIGINLKWKLKGKELVYATIRMLSQLLLIGYFLTYIFKQDNPLWTIIMLAVMLIISGWISLYSVRHLRSKNLLDALLSLSLGALPVLFLVTIVVIPNSKWYDPAFIIPLAGMIFANAMNAIGVASERFDAEMSRDAQYENARNKALSACLIPQINSFMAVGLVSLPGMMTGQILAGVEPLIAVRYQIVVMSMILGAGGLSAIIYLLRQRRQS